MFGEKASEDSSSGGVAGPNLNIFILKIPFLRRKTKNMCSHKFSVTAFQFKKAINDVSVGARIIEQNKFLHQVLI